MKLMVVITLVINVFLALTLVFFKRPAKPIRVFAPGPPVTGLLMSGVSRVVAEGVGPGFCVDPRGKWRFPPCNGAAARRDATFLRNHSHVAPAGAPFP